MAQADRQIVTTEAGFVPPRSEPSWQESVRLAVRDPSDLAARLGLPPQVAAEAADAVAGSRFPLFVPREYLARIKVGDPADPLLLQVLPTPHETASPPANYLPDPVGDQRARRAPGVLQKYDGRALLLVGRACPVHCRYCFRRVFLGAHGTPWDVGPDGRTDAALEWIAGHADIEEVILSGGDPLMLPDGELRRLCRALEGMAHVRTLRLHTRMPIMIPQRVDAALLDWIGGSTLRVVVVLHSNHPREWDDEVAAAARRLGQSGAMLLNQAVLLRGINDEAAVLAELCRRLVAAGVLPYYLHQLDPVVGAAHFEVPVERGKEIMAALRKRLPGYAVPRYVMEQPGARSKIPID